MKILITGGAGFVGGTLAEYLRDSHEVTVIDNLQFGKDVPDGVKFYRMGIGTYARNCKEEFDVVIHAATANIIYGMEDPFGLTQTNLTDTIDLFKAYQNTPIIYLSTASVYGNNPDVITEDSPISCSNFYAMTKYMAEQWLVMYHKRYMIYRLSNVYGPRQRPDNPYCGVIGKLLDCHKNGKKFNVYGNGNDTRTYTFVSDVVSVICDNINSFDCTTRNITSGVDHSIMDLLSLIPCDFIYVDQRVIDTVRRRLVTSKYPSDRQYVSLEEGLKMT